MCQENIRNNIEVSVVMAVYNGEKYIREQIDSIVVQLSDNDELIISYDESTDDTLNIIKDYSSKDTRISIYKNKYASGVVRNFQNALEKSSGEIIFYSDQDDIWLKDKKLKVLSAFKDDSVSVVVHDGYLTDKKLEITHNSIFELRGGARTSVTGNLIRLSYIGCCMAFRAKYKKVILPIPTKYRSHDWWTGTICSSANGRMVALEDKLIFHRLHQENATPSQRPSIHYQFKIRWILLKNLILRYNERTKIM